ncbi:sugar porter family MFS transporter [Saccharopolyspora rhizosphaerae]|uniref:Sugar porter family MFS transporter n=1 Tax=Saccharopolyspora rhizosphaerae TaxID=2492662 RepID=A0A3R8P822_9PSEU|nr:sugar porter family MFS transporter [Saccharopolyspora rhizosphaerae]RRO18693.1 sugar porter family MFS transporter [Saccharopolyspora rhizosphaerae]
MTGSTNEVEPRTGSGGAVVVGASLTAALGGLLFGYDTGVISTALLYISPEFELSSVGQQVLVSSLLVGAVIGVLGGGPLADRYGRRRVLLGVVVLFTAATVACALASDAVVVTASRGVLGLAIGASSLVVPTYIAEMAPRRRRGALVSLHQLMVTVGILASYLVGYALSSGGHWRWMFAVAVVPSVVMLAGLLVLPESPRWLVGRGRRSEARDVLLRTRPAEDVADELAEITATAHAEQRISYRALLGRGYRRWVSVGVAAAGTSQVVGVNAVIYYAPTILTNAGFGDAAAILASVGIGTVNVLFTVLALVFIDRLGRRPLILGGTVVVIAALVVVGALFTQPLRGPVAFGVIGALIVYEAAFACSLGIAIWLVNSEIFPNSVRGKAASFGIVTHWGLDLAVSISVLTLIQALGAPGVFWLYALLGTVGLAYLVRWLPETKNRSLEEIEASLRAEPAPESSRS